MIENIFVIVYKVEVCYTLSQEFQEAFAFFILTGISPGYSMIM